MKLFKYKVTPCSGKGNARTFKDISNVGVTTSGDLMIADKDMNIEKIYAKGSWGEVHLMGVIDTEEEENEEVVS